MCPHFSSDLKWTELPSWPQCVCSCFLQLCTRLLLSVWSWVTKQPAFPNVLVLEFCRSYNQCSKSFAFNIGQHLLMKVSCRLYWKVKSNLELEIWVTTSKMQTGLVSAKGTIPVSPWAEGCCSVTFVLPRLPIPPFTCAGDTGVCSSSSLLCFWGTREVVGTGCQKSRS